jgi:hydrogenase maturation protein HypF
LINEEAITTAVSILKSGGILAVKGIGGYHYVCSPMMEETVLNLRRLKGREEKPFAVMFPNMESIEEYCLVSDEERELLLSKARPIVLLYTRNKSMAEATNKGGIYCGAFLPYTPLQILLTRHCGPLIMTSANRSGAPIIKDDVSMMEVKSPYLKGILYHKRRIVRSVDDSVAKVIDGKPQLIRRSRGYVPYPVFLNPGKGDDTGIFAAGGDLKAAFCLYKKGSAVVSQYFGDLEEQTVLEEYKKAYKDLTGLLNIAPHLAVCDLHPNYHSALYAGTLNLPVLAVQHHHAHIASVMAEHDLKGPVIGIAFDGTGYGTDGNIWGGEFLICEGPGFTRAAHLSYTPILGGDGSMKDGKKTAACFLLQAGLKEEVRDERLDIIKAAIDNKINTVLTSSMGRLFDAVASILDICQENRYEGECAVLLEKEALLAVRNHIEQPENLTFAIHKKSGIIEIDPRPVIKAISTLRRTRTKASLALGFHYSAAKAVLRVCEIIREEQNINTVALSGGVFQNTILTERVLKLLREKDFSVYINMAVPPNDGSISLGQTYIGLMSLN